MTLPYFFARYNRFRLPPKFYKFHLIVEGDMLINDKTLINNDKPNSCYEAIVAPMDAIRKV